MPISTPEPHAAGSRGAAASASPSTARLLVVDDDDNNRDMISRRLARKGFDVSVAVDGLRALDAIEGADAATPFDLILLDIEMPGMSGFDVLRRLREEHPSTRLPVIIATARHDREDIVQALGMGANDYVTKPIDFAVVMARVEAALGHKRAVDRIVALEAEVRRRADQLQRVNDRMRHSLEMAAKVQQSLLPPQRQMTVHGVELAWTYRPCDELGGDTLGAFELSDGQIGLYLLDVSGHGVPSSLLSVTLGRTLVPTPGQPSFVERRGPTGAIEPRPPADVVAELNRRFPMGDRGGQYFTIFYGVLDVARSQLRYTSAGHPPVVLVPAGGTRSPKVLHGEGLAVGWFTDATFEEITVDLAPGDRLFAYSDGVIETMDGGSGHFGGGRLAALLGRTRCDHLSGCLDGVLSALDEFRAGTEPLDDVTILALQMPVPMGG